MTTQEENLSSQKLRAQSNVPDDAGLTSGQIKEELPKCSSADGGVPQDIAQALDRLSKAKAQHAQVQQDIKEVEVSIALSKLAWRPHLDCLKSQEKSMKEQQGIE